LYTVAAEQAASLHRKQREFTPQTFVTCASVDVEAHTLRVAGELSKADPD
jgi:hypothetical protein